MKRLVTILTFLSAILLILSACGDDDDRHEWTLQLYDGELVTRGINHLGAIELYEGEYLFSVSPSGENIIILNVAAEIDFDAVVPRFNLFGSSFGHISLFTRHDDGFALASRIYIEDAADSRLGITLFHADQSGLDWCPNETRILFSPVLSDHHAGEIGHEAFSSIFMADFAAGAIEDITGGIDDGIIRADGFSDYLPTWRDAANFTFVRYSFGAYGVVQLMTMNIDNRRPPTILTDLRVGGYDFIANYVVYENHVYFSHRGWSGWMDGGNGLFATSIDSDDNPRRLLSFSDIHSAFAVLTSLEISPNGRWALMTFRENRFLRGNAIAELNEGIVGRHHSVGLFDLHNGIVVDPFIHESIAEGNATVTAATFAADGQSIISQVFGSGGQWSVQSYEQISLWQTNLDDGSFTSTKILQKEGPFGGGISTRISKHDNGTFWLSTFSGLSPRADHFIVTP